MTPIRFSFPCFWYPPPPPPLLCVCVFHRYTKLNFLINSQISHAHPCMLWPLPQKSFSSLYLHKWTQLCKKEKLKYQVLAQWKGRKPKKKKVHILIQWTCRLHTTVLKGVSPKLLHELVYLAVASGLCCTKCLCCTKSKARSLWFDFHSCFLFFVFVFM